MIGTIAAAMASMMRVPRRVRRANHCVAAADVSGSAISRTKASTNGATSMIFTRSGPTNNQRYSGKNAICSSISNGAAARSRSDAAPANPLKTMT